MSFKLRYPVGDSEFLFPWSIVCGRTSRKIVWNFIMSRHRCADVLFAVSLRRVVSYETCQQRRQWCAVIFNLTASACVAGHLSGAIPYPHPRQEGESDSYTLLKGFVFVEGTYGGMHSSIHMGGGGGVLRWD